MCNAVDCTYSQSVDGRLVFTTINKERLFLKRLLNHNVVLDISLILFVEISDLCKTRKSKNSFYRKFITFIDVFSLSLSLSRPFMRFLMLQAHVYSNSHSFGKHKFQVIDFTSRRVFCSRKCFYLTYLSLLLNVSFCFSVSSFAQSLFSVRFLVFVFVLDGYVMLAQKSLVRHVILFMNFLFFVLEHKQLMAITIVVVYPDVWLKNVSQAGIMMFH